MDANSQYDLYLIKNELKSIIDELYNISAGVARDFEGIGNEICSDTIESVADHYSNVLRKLNKMDTSKVTEEFAAKKKQEEEAKKKKK